MVNLRKYKDKRIAIYGMGLTGRSTARALKKLGAQALCWDDNIKVRKVMLSARRLASGRAAARFGIWRGPEVMILTIFGHILASLRVKS